METLTSPLLKAPARHEADLMITDAELATMIDLARSRRARGIVIGSGRTENATQNARAIKAAWDRAGGQTLGTVTWAGTGASWLRHATRFADTDPDLWVM